MARLGTAKNPVIVRVQNEERANEILSICETHGWQFIIGIEPDKPEDISDIDRALSPAPSHRVGPTISRNEPCPCGSGKKYKRCCGH
ncbi:SEC-C metal-binding domain-containing protein [Dehalococcoidia bacterium]|nr:SEC-C metal-binding domain-containing protein [Dehalococcoidia bacterium]MCL0073935.1 SEC-C metal-binding domain-containing protein [Dehalococcoidia bacterium]MCL0076230.1 SEC-C metal-binding domain-containing protein [Dehalococcoidia bacterium]